MENNSLCASVCFSVYCYVFILLHMDSVMFATMAITCVFAAVLFVAGLGIFSVYAGCDPITLGRITKKDQVMPLYVMEHLGYLKGIPGLLVACLFSGTLR